MESRQYYQNIKKEALRRMENFITEIHELQNRIRKLEDEVDQAQSDLETAITFLHGNYAERQAEMNYNGIPEDGSDPSHDDEEGSEPCAYCQGEGCDKCNYEGER